MNIIGYINPNKFLPSPLVVVAQSTDGFYAIYPSLEKYKLPNTTSPEELSKLNNFTFEKNSNLKLQPAAFSFGMPDGVVVTGSPYVIKCTLRASLKETANSYDEKTRELFEEFYENLHAFFTLEDFRNLISGKLNIAVIVTSRKLKNKHGEKAPRVLIQRIEKSNRCTLFRKNIYAFQSPQKAKIPDQLLISLVGLIHLGFSSSKL